MTASPLRQRFMRLALVNILSNVTVPLVGLVDTAMLGHLDDIRFLAGVALASVLFDYVYWSFGFLRMGTTGTTAQAVGRGDPLEVRLVLLRSLAVALMIGFGLLLLQWPIRELGFWVLSGESGVIDAGRDYFDGRIWGAPANLCCMVLVGWLLGAERARAVLVMTIVANVSNVALNWLFIIELQMAAYGAGLASMLSQYLMLVVGAALCLRGRESIDWRWSQVFDRSQMGAMFRLNRDILIRTLCLITSFAVFINLSSMLGTVLLAANSILLRLLSLASYMIDGAAFASESLAGVFRGQQNRDALRRLFRLSLSVCFGFAALFLLALFAGGERALALLTSHREVIEAGQRYMPWLIPVLAFGSLAYAYDGLFLGLTEGRLIRNSMLLSTLLAFLPLALIAVRVGDNHLLWASMTLFMVARTATLARATRYLAI